MWSWATNKYGGRAALQSLSDILIHGDTGNVSHGSQSSEFKRILDGNKIFTELSHVGKLREVREVREKLRDKCSTSYGKRLLSLNFPNDRRE